MEKDKKLKKDNFYTIFSSYFSQFCNIFRSFYSAGVLGPIEYGIWSIVQFYINFGKHASLGVNDAAQRSITQNIFKRKKRENFYIIKFYLIFILMLSALFLVLGFIAFNYLNLKDKLHSYTIIFFTFTIILLLFERFSFSILSAYGKFKYSSIQTVMFSIISLVIVFLLVREYRVVGMYWSYFLGLLIPVILIFFIFSKTIFYNVKLIFNASKPRSGYTRSLFLNSLFLNLIIFSSTIVLTLERFFVSFMCSNYDNGIYFMAANIAQALTLAAYSITLVIYQRINLNYGKDGNIENTFLKTLEASKKVSIFYPVFLIAAFFFIPCFFYLFFKKYLGSIYYLRWLSIAGFFYSIFLLFNYQLMAIKKQKKLITSYLILLVLGSFLYYFILKKYNINVLPYAVVSFNFIMLLNNFIMSSVYCDSKNSFNSFINLMLPFSLVLIISTILDYFIVFSNQALSYAFNGFVVLFLYLIFMFFSKKIKSKKYNL